MPSTVVNLLIIVVTILIAISGFTLYATYISTQGLSLLQQEYVIGISKNIQITLSQLTYKGLQPSYKYFNVSYLVWVKSPTSEITVIPFVASPQVNPYYYSPPQTQNASLFFSSAKGYIQVKNFSFTSNVYSPQQGQFLGKVNAYAFNISSNQTYILSAKIRPGQIIILWILYYYNGKWYRIDYTYINPTNAGLGLFALSSSGNYVANSGNLNNPAPHIVTSQGGLGFGLWFQQKTNATTKTLILNVTISPTANGDNFSILIWEIGNKLYVGTYDYNSKTQYQTYLYSIAQGYWYFINFSFGSLLKSTNSVNITLYSSTGKLLNYTKNGLSIPESNGYISVVSFGSRSLVNVISQAFFVTLQSGNSVSLTSFYNVSTIMLKNGFVYNNTYNYNWTIVHSNFLNAIGYWYFVYPSYPPPNVINGILWYSPSGSGNGNNKYPSIYYIPEQGYNTYVLI
ncbi:hypothetical protein V6M85_09330 [Sulfolobus tengchongensis]|uniref:Uncharacterized protein n=1 Tax=Sulfolobus tengchongensis TaxID=207809 RepID=A0AAX4KYL8_9CREN